jgi:hypothetical protein
MTVSSSLRLSTRHSPAYAATPHRHGSLPTARQTCRKPRTSIMYPHSKPTTVCHQSQMYSQSPSEPHGTPTTMAALATPRIPMCSRPCLRRDSHTTAKPRLQHQGRVNTSLPKKQLHPCRVVVRISSHAWYITVVISHRHHPPQCQTRPVHQHIHRTQTCTVAAVHGDVAVTSTKWTTVPHPSAASNPVWDLSEQAVIHQTLNRRRKTSSLDSVREHGICSTRDIRLGQFKILWPQLDIISSTAFSGVRNVSFVTTTPSLDLFCFNTFGQFPRAAYYYPYCAICKHAYADLYIL